MSSSSSSSLPVKPPLFLSTILNQNNTDQKKRITTYFNQSTKTSLSSSTLSSSSSSSSSSTDTTTTEEKKSDDCYNPEDDKLLTEGQYKAFQIIKQGKNVLVSGEGGTGKSHLIKHITKYFNYRFNRRYQSNKFAVTATTGAAAILINALTFHGWAGLGLFGESVRICVEKILRSSFLKKRWTTIQVLIIDEISMFRSDLFDKFDKIAKEVRRNDLPFGGIQVLMFGDFLQMPPVVKNDESQTIRYLFASDIWKQSSIHCVVLKQNLRQSDNLLRGIMNEARRGILSDDSIEVLSMRVVDNIYDVKPDPVSGVVPAILMSRNEDVTNYNTKKLDEIDSPAFTYNAEYTSMLTGTDAEREIAFMKKNTPIPETIVLKEGAQVMLRYNKDVSNKLANGSLGIVDKIEKNGDLYVKFHSSPETPILIRRHKWERSSTKKNIFAAICIQIPVIPAWAITIHKSQGQQFDLVGIDMKGIFEVGQGYTALSRVTTLDGLFISNFDPDAIVASGEALDFYNTIDPPTTSSLSSIQQLSSHDIHSDSFPPPLPSSSSSESTSTKNNKKREELNDEKEEGKDNHQSIKRQRKK